MKDNIQELAIMHIRTGVVVTKQRWVIVCEAVHTFVSLNISILFLVK